MRVLMCPPETIYGPYIANEMINMTSGFHSLCVFTSGGSGRETVQQRPGMLLDSVMMSFIQQQHFPSCNLLVLYIKIQSLLLSDVCVPH